MPERMPFEAHLAELFTRYAELAPVTVDHTIVERALATGRPRRSLSLRMPTFSRPVYVWAAILLLLLAAAVAGLAASRLLPRPDQLPGRFTQTGPSQIGFIEAAALMADGRTMVAGSASSDWAQSESSMTVEFFDPSTNSFMPGPMVELRRGFTLTSLLDGRVLLAGGYLNTPDGAGSSPADAELFDPRTGRFESTGSLISPRYSHTATLLQDGRVLVVGGYPLTDNATTLLYSAEIFDPAAGTWSPAGELTTDRSIYKDILLRDGRVLFVGGWSGEAIDLDSVELFDPRTLSFADGGHLTQPRRDAAAAVLADGRVLIAGGSIENSTLATTEIYDPATGRSSLTDRLSTARSGAAAVSMPDGRVIVAGGWNNMGGPLSVEIYDPATEHFSNATPATRQHLGPAMPLRDDRILFTGYNNDVFDLAASTDVIKSPARTDGVFVATGTPITDRTNQVTTKLIDGRVLIAGGADHGTLDDLYRNRTAEIFNPVSGSFAATSNLMVPLGQTTSGNQANSTVVLADGRILFATRNYHGAGMADWSFQLYDAAAGKFVSGGAPVTTKNGRAGAPRIVRLSDGQLVLVGESLTEVDTSSAQVYRLTMPGPTLTAAGELSGCQVAAEVAVARLDRLVVLCRAQSAGGSLALFDLPTGTATRLDVPIGDGPAALVTVSDGRVLVATGLPGGELTLVDPTTGAAIPAGTTPVAQPDPTAQFAPSLTLTLLDDGRVLIISGADALIWDPATAATRVIPGPLAPRYGHSSTLLDDGRVLVFGGTTWPADAGLPIPPGAEIFDPANLP
jgi:Galactose oxidase, central domain